MQFIDATIFLQFLTRDDPALAEVVSALFHKLGQGDEHATTTEVVIATAVNILSAKAPQQISRGDISRSLTPLLMLQGIHMPHKRTCLRALEVYSTYPDLTFVDALSVALMEREGVSDLLSCNTAFDQIPSIRRIKPAAAGPKAA